MATAAQRRAEAKAQYDAFLETCPSRQLLERISDKWVTRVLCALGGAGARPRGPAYALEPRPTRHSELARLLAGASQKMLTQTLRALERDGLLTRTVIPTNPATVTYELTDLGLSLLQAVRTLKTWAETHMDEVLAHRARHGGGAGARASIGVPPRAATTSARGGPHPLAGSPSHSAAPPERCARAR